MENFVNHYKFLSLTWLIIFIGILANFIGFESNPVIMQDNSYEGLFIILFVITITIAFAMTLNYWIKSNYFKQVINSSILAKWNYTEYESQAFREAIYKDNQKTRKGIGLILMGITLVIIIPFMIGDEDFIATGIITFVLIGLIPISAIIISKFAYNFKSKFPLFAFVSESGVYFDYNIYRYNKPNTPLVSSEIINQDSFNYLSIVYKAKYKRRDTIQEVSIAIPNHKIEEAKSLVDKIILLAKQTNTLSKQSNNANAYDFEMIYETKIKSRCNIISIISLIISIIGIYTFYFGIN